MLSQQSQRDGEKGSLDPHSALGEGRQVPPPYSGSHFPGACRCTPKDDTQRDSTWSSVASLPPLCHLGKLVKGPVSLHPPLGRGSTDRVIQWHRPLGIICLLFWGCRPHPKKAPDMHLCLEHLQEKPEDLRQRTDYIMIYYVSYDVTQRSGLTESFLRSGKV